VSERRGGDFSLRISSFFPLTPSVRPRPSSPVVAEKAASDHVHAQQLSSRPPRSADRAMASALRPRPLSGWWYVLVEIGPEGGRRHNNPLSSLTPLACYQEGCYFYLCTEGRCRNLITRNGNKEILSRPRTERTAVAFGTLFSLQCVRFITKGFAIYRRPLGIVICLNYTFSVPDKRL
jgi:hypothetical protein